MTLVACGQTQQAARIKNVTPAITMTVDPSAGVALAEHFEEWTTAIKVGEYVATEAFLASLYTPPQLPVTQPVMESEPVMRSTNGGSHSDAFWWGVSVCEQGGRNDPFFGYMSFMDGSEGGKPWAEQVAAANALGEGAWAPACVAAGYAASPNG